MTPLGYVGLAYAAVWLVIFAYAWRLTAVSKRLEQKLNELERDATAYDALIAAVDRDLPASPDTGNWNSNEIRYAGLAKTFPLAATCDFKAKTLKPGGEHPAYDLERCFRVGWDAGFHGPWCIEHGNRDRAALFRELALVRDMLRGWINEARN